MGTEKPAATSSVKETTNKVIEKCLGSGQNIDPTQVQQILTEKSGCLKGVKEDSWVSRSDVEANPFAR